MVALAVGIAGLAAVLSLYLMGPIRAWRLKAAAPAYEKIRVRIAATPGHERLLPRLEGHAFSSIAGGARVLAVDVAAGTATLELEARREPDGRRRWGGRWIRAGEMILYQDAELYFPGVVLDVLDPEERGAPAASPGP